LAIGSGSCIGCRTEALSLADRQALFARMAIIRAWLGRTILRRFSGRDPKHPTDQWCESRTGATES
jgi:hypothetical protein